MINQYLIFVLPSTSGFHPVIFRIIPVETGNVVEQKRTITSTANGSSITQSL